MNNTSIEGGLLFTLENPDIEIKVEFCSFVNNSADFSIFSLENSFLSISNSVFHNNLNTLFSLTESRILLNNLSLVQQICSENQLGCLIVSEKKSSIFISNCVFHKVSSFKEGLLYLMNSEIVIENSKLEDFYCEKFEGNCIMAYSSKLSIQRTFFTNFDYNCLFLKNSELAILQSEFRLSFLHPSQNSLNFGAIYCEDCLALEILDSFFENFHDIFKGAAIELLANEIFSKEIKSSYIIKNCYFFNNSAQFGGAIANFNLNLTILQCIFFNNLAKKGGALFFDTNLNNIDLGIFNNSFVKNCGFKEGGAIKWTSVEPNYDEFNRFEGNFAEYGMNFAAFPIRINLRIENFLEENFVDLKNVSSGQKLNISFFFEFIDVYNEIVTTIEDNK